MARKLKDKLISELEIRGRSKNTKKDYVRSMEKFIEFHKRAPDELDVEDVKKYVMYLVKERKVGCRTVNKELGGIMFFYRHVLARPWYPGLIPRMKTPKTLPVVLSQEEVSKMIDSVRSVRYKAILMTMYSTGLRNSEIRNLKISDIDSSRMVIHVRAGKGGKDRECILSPVCLKWLRAYWRLYRTKCPVKSEWLFIPAKNNRFNKGMDKPLSHTALGYVVDLATKAAGIKKKPTRIRYATPLQHIYLNVA